MKTNHTKDKLTPDLVSIDDTKPTKNEQSGVRGIVEEFKTWAQSPARPEDETKTFTDNIADWLTQTLRHLQERHEQEKQEMYESLDANYQLIVQNEKRALVEEILEAKFTQVGSVNAWVTTDEIEAIAQRHGLSTKE